jgi:tetratricopeptide (TPR) repeat protein
MRLSGHKIPTAALMSASLLLYSCATDPQKAKTKYFEAGQKYMQERQYGDAAVEFKNALRLDPRFVDAYYELAQASLAQNDWNAAYSALEKTVELNPTRLDARLDRGRIFLAARQFREAEDEANFIIERRPSDVGAYQLLGAALIGEQQPDTALKAFNKVTELLPTDPSAYVNIALVEVSLRRFPDAEQHLKKAVSMDPKDTQACIDLAHFYRLQNRVQDAQQVLQNAIATNPTGMALYVDWASMLTSLGKKDGAEALLAKLRQELPNSPDAAIAIGDYYLEQKDTVRALAEYQRGLSASARNPLAIDKRIEDLYLSTGQTQLAAALDNRLMKESLKDVTVRINHGRLLLAQAKTQNAIASLQKVVADAGDSAQAFYYLAMAYQQSGNPGQERAALYDALKLSPELPIALQALAGLEQSQGNIDQAVQYASGLVQKFPADHTYRLLLGQFLARQGQIRKAEEQFAVAEQLVPGDPGVRLGLAQIYAAQKKWVEAESELETTLRLDPRDSTALGLLVDVLSARNQAAQARVRVRQYVDANPNDSNGYVSMGALDFSSKDYVNAQRQFSRSIELDPTNVQAYLRLGKAYEANGQSDLAIQQYQKALDLQPKLAALATMVGNLYLEKGNLEIASKYYLQALDADPNFAIANANLAWVDVEAGKNLDVALGRAQKAKSLMPDLPSISDTLAWVMYKKGNYAGAVPLLQECVQKAPNSSKFRYHLGMVLVAAGQKAKGKEQLKNALRMKLESTDAQEAQQTLAQSN